MATRLLHLIHTLMPRLALIPWLGLSDGAQVWQVMSRGLRHEMRAPPSAIITLAGLYWAGAMDGDLLARQVVMHAREALLCVDELGSLADEAVHRYRMVRTDLAELVAASIDEAWPAAKEAAIVLQGMECPCPVWVKADQRMLAALVGCMLKRAIALSQVPGKVRVGIGAGHAHYCVDLSFRMARPRAHDPLAPSSAAGMLARRVMKRHGGLLAVVGEGPDTAWRLVLPRARTGSKKAPEGAFLPSNR